MSETMNNAGGEDFWARLSDLPRPTLAELFEAPGRVDRWTGTLETPGGAIRLDWSKTHLDESVYAAMLELAEAMGVEAAREALYAGEVVNPSEGRAAVHTAQRGVGESTGVEEAAALHQRMALLVDAVRDGALGPVRSLIHIGIGGSALGPALAVDALGREADGPTVYVVSNIDDEAIEEAYTRCDPETTLIAVASKTFTTVETLTNAANAIDWLRAGGIDDPYGRVIALTADPEKAVDWGVDETRVLPFPQSVGGRYSLWSSIGFPVALALGWEAFAEMLAGAAAVDTHFRDTPLADNLVARAAFADLYYAQVRGCQTRAVFAYDERLRLLPSYLQQLEMESNGKQVTAQGAPLGRPSAPITWGGVGTDAQHAVFQLLHQGTHLVPVDFIAAKSGGAVGSDQHRTLLANCFAQGAALMAGKPSDDPARAYPGDRPSATILLDDLNPATFGALIAFHEHRTFVAAAMLGINPFDQFGVELGKEIAKAIESGKAEFDPSTTALLEAAGIG